AAFRIAIPRDHRAEGIERGKIRRRQRDVDGGRVLFDALDARRSRNRDDVGTARQQPGERELRRRAALLPREILDAGHEIEIALEVLALKARVLTTPVAWREIVHRAEPSGEEPAAERAVGDEADAELTTRRQQPVFGI